MNKQATFTFIDLFAGIGGFHIAMHHLGGRCVFASEMDVYARKTYKHNFKKIAPALFENQLFNDDIRTVTPANIPDFDVLCAGFPCQPFSQAGYKRGFNDNHNSERGNLFFNIAEIIAAKKPKAFFLENVRGIVSHDKGNTFKVIRNILENELGYSFYFKIVKASDYGLPQLRPRAFMVGFRDEGLMKQFTFPAHIPLKFTMSDVWGGVCSREIGFTLRVGGRGSKIHDRRNWDAYLVDGVVKQLSYKEGRKMQGFPADFEFPVSQTQAIKQLGNSVAIDAVQAVGKQLIQYLQLLENTPATLSVKPLTVSESANTNFIFEIKNIENKQVDVLNRMAAKHTIKDKIEAIYQLGGELTCIKAEKEALNEHLKKLDASLLTIIGHILLCFYGKQISKLADIVREIHKIGFLNKQIDYENQKALKSKVVTFLKMKSIALKEADYENIALVAPSTTRYRYGKIYKEKGGKLYFKLNLQFQLLKHP